jgi:hypothetical protein
LRLAVTAEAMAVFAAVSVRERPLLVTATALWAERAIQKVNARPNSTRGDR